MSNGDHVRPGEVISSSLINQILDRLSDLEQAAPGPGPGPGPGGPIVIDGFAPPIEQEVGAVLAILGSNLPFPPTSASITVGSVPVPAANLRIAPSNRERLEFVIPDLGNLQAGGDDFFVRVFSGSNSAQRLYRILPSSGGPATPSITGIRPVGGVADDPITMGQVAIIEGTNFSDNAANNTITFTPLGIVPPADSYPRPGGPDLTVISTADDEIRVEVPDMSEVELGIGLVQTQITITVSGAPAPAIGEFETFRS